MTILYLDVASTTSKVSSFRIKPSLSMPIWTAKQMVPIADEISLLNDLRSYLGTHGIMVRSHIPLNTRTKRIDTSAVGSIKTRPRLQFAKMN